MKKIIPFIFALSFLAAFTACNWTEPTSMTYAFGFVRGSSILSDGGMTFNVTASECGDNWKLMDRGYFEFKLGKKINEKTYEATVIYATDVHLKEPVDSDDPEIEKYGKDAVGFADCYISGTGRNIYLNFYEVFFTVSGSNMKHDINFMFNKEKSSKSDTLFFELKHNGHGETFDNPDVPQEKLVLSTEYTSLNLEEYIKAGATKAIFAIEYDWHKYDDFMQTYLRETEHVIKSGSVAIESDPAIN